MYLRMLINKQFAGKSVNHAKLTNTITTTAVEIPRMKMNAQCAMRMQISTQTTMSLRRIMLEWSWLWNTIIWVRRKQELKDWVYKKNWCKNLSAILAVNRIDFWRRLSKQPEDPICGQKLITTIDRQNLAIFHARMTKSCEWEVYKSKWSTPPTTVSHNHSHKMCQLRWTETNENGGKIKQIYTQREKKNKQTK